jgi:membrane fusion protein, copper/silver efflux system
VEVLATPLDDYSYVIESGLKNGDEVVSDALFMMDSDAQINGLY